MQFRESQPPNGREILAQAEAADGYRAAIAASPANRYARKDQLYIPFFVPPAAAQRLLGEVDKIPLLDGANVIVMHRSADGGLPHTRPLETVCMPAHYVVKASTADLATTLRHEAIHLHQRAHPQLWAAALMRDGWTPLGAGAVPTHHRALCRLNPDTMHPVQFWSWDGAYVPLPLFRDEQPPDLDAVSIRWLDRRSGDFLSAAPPSFKARYGDGAAQPEHPYELAAVEIAAATANSLLSANLVDEYLAKN